MKMGKRHLFLVLLLVAGTLAEDVAQPPPPPSEEKPAEAEAMDPVASAPIPPESQPAEESSGLILTDEGDPKSETSDKPVLEPQAAVTKIIVETIKFRWTIVNYSHNNLENTQAIYSPRFWGKNSKDYKWQLKVFPKGVDEREPDGVGIYLALSGKFGITANAKISLINNAGQPVLPHEFTYHYQEPAGHGWNAFTLKGTLDFYKTLYVPNDRLTLEVEIVFTPAITTASAHCPPTDKECKKMPYQNNFNNDVHVYSGTQSVKSHIAAIAAHSTWLKGQVEVSRPYTVDIPPHMNVSYDDLREAIRFIYTGEIDKSKAKRMSEVAETLGMAKLKEYTEELLCLSGQT